MNIKMTKKDRKNMIEDLAKSYLDDRFDQLTGEMANIQNMRLALFKNARVAVPSPEQVMDLVADAPGKKMHTRAKARKGAKRRPMTLAQKKAIGKRMKAMWAAKRKAAAAAPKG